MTSSNHWQKITTNLEVNTKHKYPSKFKGNRDFPGGPVAKTALPMQGVQVQSLVVELRSHMPRGTARKNKKQKTPLNKQKEKKSKVTTNSKK